MQKNKKIWLFLTVLILVVVNVFLLFEGREGKPAEAQICVNMMPHNCSWISLGGGEWRTAICPAGSILVGLQLYCSEDCGDQDEDWVKSLYCCSWN